MNADPEIAIYKNGKQQKKTWNNKLKDILDQADKEFDANKSEQPTGNLTTTFQKPAGEANPYVQFVYSPQKFWIKP